MFRTSHVPSLRERARDAGREEQATERLEGRREGRRGGRRGGRQAEFPRAGPRACGLALGALRSKRSAAHVQLVKTGAWQAVVVVAGQGAAAAAGPLGPVLNEGRGTTGV